MFLALWEFDVKPGCEARFESVYGRKGDWAKLFGRDPHYRQTILLRDPTRPRTYLTLDFWANQKAYESFETKHLREYVTLDRKCEALTARERQVGSYEALPERAPGMPARSAE